MDVAAHGIHVQDIAHVINHDLPEAAENFIHRVGRTGRAGERDVASTLREQAADSVVPIGTGAWDSDRESFNEWRVVREENARPSTWHVTHNGDMRPRDGLFARGIPASTDRKLISAARSTSGFEDGRTLKRISVPSWMCRVCCSFETSRSI